jgi:hypothetical protein
MQQMARIKVAAVAVAALSASMLSTVEAMPYVMLKNKAPKCFLVAAPSNTRMIISYHAPGTTVTLLRIQEIVGLNL